MKKLVAVIFAVAGFALFKADAQTINTLPLSNNSVCQGVTFNVAYSVNGVFNAGNLFTAELSDNSGSFASAVPIGTVNSTASGNINVTIPVPSAAGVAYRIRVSASNPVVIGADNGADIAVKALPSVSFTAPANQCVNAGSIALNGGLGNPAGGIGIYSGQGVFSGSFYPNLAGAGTFSLQYNYTAPNGCALSANANVSVFALPTVTLPPFTAVCSNGAAFTLAGGSPAGGTYMVDGVTATQFDPATAGPGNHQVTYSFTDANGCTASASQFIFVNQPPVISYTVPASACVGSVVNLQFSPSGGTLLVDGVASANQFTANTIGTTVVNYSFTDASTGCTSTITKNITINALPIVTIPATASYCNSNGSVILNGGSPAGGVYSGIGVLNDSVFYPTLVPGSSTIVNYTYTNALTGCSASASQTITLSPAPTLSIVVPGIVCIDGGTVSLSGSPAGGLYTGIGVSGTDFNPLVAGLGTFTITYTYSDGLGCTNFINQNITVTNGSAPVLQPIGPFCIDAVSQTFSAAPIGGIYSGNGVIGNTFNPSIAGLGQHQIVYEVTFTNGCVGFDTIMVTVNALPIVNFTTSAQVCVNANAITLNSGLPLGGTYSGNGVSGNVFSPVTAGVGNQVVTYTYTDVNGCTNAQSQTILVNALPTVSLDTFAVVCNGTQLIPLTGGLPAGGTFAGNGVVGGNQFNPALNGPGVFQITYIFTDANSCVNSTSQNLTVAELTVNAGLDQTISCGTTAQLNASVSYSGTGSLTYSWSPAQGLSNTTIANPVASPGVTTNYTVNVSDGVCGNSDNVSVIYNPVSFGISFTASPISFNQLPPFVVNFTNPYAALGQYNFTWIFGDGFSQFNNAQNFAYTYYNNGVYTVQLVAQDIATGCVDTIPATFSINISGSNCTSPATINQTGPIIGCSGTPVLLTTTVIPGATYQWYFNGAVIGGANTASYNCFYNGTQLSYSGFYSVLVNDVTNNCVSMSNVVQVVFNQPPAPPIITITDPFDPCTLNNTATLQANSGYASYAWQRLIDTTIIGTQQSITITQTGVYNVIVTDNNGCSASAYLPIANFGPDPSSICFVTVDSLSQKNFVYWQNPQTTVQIDKFLLLRQSDIQFGFDTIAIINYDPVTNFYVYHDTDMISLPTWGINNDSVNTAAHFYTYGLALMDNCGGTSIPTLYHNTINIKVNTTNSGASFDLTWNPYGGLPFGIFELHRQTTSVVDSIFDNVSSNVFSYTDFYTGTDTVIAYWITVPLQGACDTLRAASIKSRSNIIKNGGGIAFGIKDKAISTSLNMNIIPNPNNGRFILQLSRSFNSTASVGIHTITGTEVWKKDIPPNNNQINIDLPELNQGIYLVRFTENNTNYYRKLIISK